MVELFNYCTYGNPNNKNVKNVKPAGSKVPV